MFKRVGQCFLAMFRSLDLLVCTIWLCSLYPFGLADKPTGRELISSYVGRAAYNGQKWGLILAKWIDFLALKLGDGPDHCYRAFKFYSRLDEGE